MRDPLRLDPELGSPFFEVILHGPSILEKGDSLVGEGEGSLGTPVLCIEKEVEESLKLDPVEAKGSSRHRVSSVRVFKRRQP